MGAQTGTLRTIIEVDGGRDRELVLKVYPPSGNYLNDGHRIRVALPDFSLPDSELDDQTLVKVSGSEDQSPDVPIPVTTAVPSGDNLTITLPAGLAARVSTGEYLIITIGKGTGILAPETPRGFDDHEKGYPIGITFLGESGDSEHVAADKNVVVVKNPVSSTVPGATVRMELKTHANIKIGSNEEIVVDFSGPSEDASFDLPSTITPSRIKIRSNETFDPADVLVQGDQVTLTIPGGKTVDAGDYTISISQLARIKNPFAAGTPKIKIRAIMPDFEEDVITAVILRTTTVSPAAGPRGSQFTLQGKGYASGTVTVFDGEDDEIGLGETLASVKTNRGSFSVKLTARGSFRLSDDAAGNPRRLYTVNTRDSNGVTDSTAYVIKSSMSFAPSTVGIGDTLNVSIEDWEDSHQEVAAVHIGGEEAWTAEPFEYTECIEYQGAAHFADDNGEVSFVVAVPQGVPPGEQTVAVYGHEALEHYYNDEEGRTLVDKKACSDIGPNGSKGNATGKRLVIKVKKDSAALVERTVEIVAESLTLSPSAAVRGQRVAISGTGFTKATGGRNDIEAVSINGRPVVEDVSGFEVSITGKFAFKVTVPPEAPIGDNEVRVEGWDHTLGQATLEVLGADITLDPAEGRRGARVELTGAGFIANEIFQAWYGDGGDVFEGDIHLGSGRADSRGGIEFAFDVPLTAAVGRTQKVTVVSGLGGRDDDSVVRAEAEHTVPTGTITTTPDRVSPGGRLTIRGEELPAFSLIRSIDLEGRDITPVPLLSTDRDGAFEAEVTVPDVEFGDLMLRIDASGVLVTHIVEVGPPPVSGDPAAVFELLIRDGVLVRVWLLEASTQEWFFYDPREAFAGFNSLETIERGTVVVLIVSEDAEYRGQSLSAGSNFVLVG